MAAFYANPDSFVTYGPDANCTLELCPLDVTIFHYRPSLAANTVFLVFFAIALIIHVALGIKWRTWVFSSVMALGCLSEVIGYGGRILMWKDPFDFAGFMVQICCITLAPTFLTAAIYLTLSKIVIYLGPQYGRFSPKLYYWVFIPCDIISLTLQAAGGAMSSSSSGSNGPAVDIAIAGLSFQVITLVVFNALAIDYAIRYWKAEGRSNPLPTKFKVFVAFLIFAMILIFIRCAFRIDELSEGYGGDLIHNEKLFIGLEGVMILISVYALIGAHPGPVFGWPDAKVTENAASKLEAGGPTRIKHERKVEPDLVVKNVRSGDSVSNLKDKIQISTGIHRMNQILRYGTWIYLDDSFSLAAYGIFNDTTLTLIDNSPMTIPSNRKRESTSTDGTSKALKSSASMSVKSTSASESQDSLSTIKPSPSSDAVADLVDSPKQPKALVLKLNIKSPKTQLATTSNCQAPSVASELNDTSARAATETPHLSTEPIISSPPTIPSPSGSAQQDQASGNTTMNQTSSSPSSTTPEPAAITEENIISQLKVSEAHAQAQIVNMQALKAQRRALAAVKEREDRLKTAQMDLDGAKKVAEEGRKALKEAKQALGKTWKGLNESMTWGVQCRYHAVKGVDLIKPTRLSKSAMIDSDTPIPGY